jgi:hypothetical protein
LEQNGLKAVSTGLPQIGQPWPGDILRLISFIANASR